MFLFLHTVLNKRYINNFFKSNDNNQKKEDGPDISVSNNKVSSLTLNELTMKAREDIL